MLSSTCRANRPRAERARRNADAAGICRRNGRRIPSITGEADAKIKSFNQAKAERYLAERDRRKR